LYERTERGVIDEAEWARVARHLAGEETPEEAEATRRWIEADPERQAIVGRLTGIWSAAAAPPRRWDSQAAWERVVAQERGDGRTAAPHVPTSAAVPDRRRRGDGWPALRQCWSSPPASD